MPENGPGVGVRGEAGWLRQADAAREGLTVLPQLLELLGGRGRVLHEQGGVILDAQVPDDRRGAREPLTHAQ